MHTDCSTLLAKPLNGEELSPKDALQIYEQASFPQLMVAAHAMRMKLHPENEVSWIIDRNVNITNICITGCRFCNFSCSKNSTSAYVTTRDEYRKKISELFALGGNQLLLQGGLNPALDLQFHCDLFRWMKSAFPELKLHALSPAEVDFMARTEKLSHTEVLQTLMNAGLDSLPGAGAEILSDRVRKIVSPSKISADGWIEVMRAAHKLGLITSATMMFGHVETIEERIEHMIRIRDLQKEKPTGAPGFLSFIPWPFYGKDTTLMKEGLVQNFPTPLEYIRLIATARLVLNNIPNIQASWLTVGKTTAAVCLYAGANDLGSIMIEENVVSSAGASYRMHADEMQQLISDSGFGPRRRNQDFTDAE
ncbi:MAG: dehypoxanthine futalosine cyclase [Bacteroidetes bacterium GWF2_43_63]|nr:MAG: dehypoxanthine futalosine cyclase [Bacteroidetes bacterium GWE2_42_42]OFY53237.1 MAG: dehypoxanthine futalosine cyclase [Bacteroidetes bacterium GWF2_43_63]HBG71771.1 dehypoxanthine futalosine cyclase [Bacteroidales bacterium]HCB61564.1 dehypoxanthine futalosine cyclase [Bacteroidales bacterium]HCY22776.1 dehypoxanthine futalosine cyclase [Bacteroidales bacterium]